MAEPLFTPAQLGSFLGRGASGVDAARAQVGETVVWGWLADVLGVDERPEPVPAPLFSWALELGAIAYENPAGFSSSALGAANRSFSSERRTEILEAVQAWVDAQAGAAAGAPQGSFPPPLPDVVDPALDRYPYMFGPYT